MLAVKKTTWFAFIGLMWLGTMAHAQSLVEIDDPAARAMERIQAVVEQRVLVADRLVSAGRFVNESIAARKLGEPERAAAALQQAEKIASEIESSLRGYLLEELLKAIIAERVALYPEKPAAVTVFPAPAGTMRQLPRPFSIQRRELQDILIRILGEERVPVELLSVALVESGFNPLALSRKGARGVWQLMPETAQRYGLKVESALDQRTDPVRSTRAAAQYLRDLYRQFGDWKLALAAYNTGEDRVQRLINRTGIRNFEGIAQPGLLPLETRNYVPAVLAAWSRMSRPQNGLNQSNTAVVQVQSQPAK
jgi:membrane-bound lytic murein transglycosylase D